MNNRKNKKLFYNIQEFMKEIIEVLEMKIKWNLGLQFNP